MFGAVRYAQNCRGVVAADTGKVKRISFRARKLSLVFGDDFLCGALQIACAAVIAESGPQAQHFLLLRRSERMDVREAIEKALVVGNHCRNACLLQHDFREPDAIRIFGAAPRQVTLVLLKPAEQSFSECGEFAALQLHVKAYSRTDSASRCGGTARGSISLRVNRDLAQR